MDLTVNKNYLLKLRHILPAFALIAWSSVLVLGLIRKVLFLGKYPMLQLDEEIWNFWIPAFFPWAPILLWLKPRFDRLVFRKNNEHRLDNDERHADPVSKLPDHRHRQNART
jgi:hypothetical protein